MSGLEKLITWLIFFAPAIFPLVMGGLFLGYIWMFGKPCECRTFEGDEWGGFEL